MKGDSITHTRWQQLKEESSEKEFEIIIKEFQQDSFDRVNAQQAITEVGSDIRIPVIAEFNDAGDLVCYRKLSDFKKVGTLKTGSLLPYVDDKGELKFTTAESSWLSSDYHRFYRRLVLAPPGSGELPLDKQDYNLWRGFAVEPKQGKWPLIQRHLKEVICHNDSELYAWLLNWV